VNVDELVTNLRTQRDERVTRIEAMRKERSSINREIKIETDELTRINRLIRAAEGRKKVDGSQ
jgi:uncharacterized coiled-coil DUF342 family protein